MLDLLTRDAMLHKSVNESRIEVITGPNGAHRRRIGHFIAASKAVLGPQLHRIAPLCADETLSIKRDFGVVNLVRVGEFVEHREVLSTSSDEVGIL